VHSCWSARSTSYLAIPGCLFASSRLHSHRVLHDRFHIHLGDCVAGKGQQQEETTQSICAKGKNWLFDVQVCRSLTLHAPPKTLVERWSGCPQLERLFKLPFDLYHQLAEMADSNFACSRANGLPRVRRVKCGEERPACIRCTSTGRTCDGYPQIEEESLHLDPFVSPSSHSSSSSSASLAGSPEATTYSRKLFIYDFQS
jgi:hypothetical protein